MTNSSPPPEYLITDNPYGTIFFGPVAPEDEDDKSALTVASRGGHYTHYNQNGNKGEVVPGSSHEHIGKELVQGENVEASKEAVAKSITAENGDICITAKQGNIKLKAQNIYIETTGTGSDGSFLVKANDHISLTAGEQMNITGAKICLVSADSITLNAKGNLNLIVSDIIKRGPLSGIMGILQGDVLAFIEEVRQTCK